MDRRTFMAGVAAAGPAAAGLARTAESRVEIIVGALSDQNWHRQIRRLGLDRAARLDHVIRKTVAIAKEFGFSPMAIDLDFAAFPSTEKSYIDELKARLKESDLWPVVEVGGVAATYDEEVRLAALEAGRRDLELAARLGVRTCTFSPPYQRSRDAGGHRPAGDRVRSRARPVGESPRAPDLPGELRLLLLG